MVEWPALSLDWLPDRKHIDEGAAGARLAQRLRRCGHRDYGRDSSKNH